MSDTDGSIDDLVAEILADPAYVTQQRAPGRRPEPAEILSVLDAIFAGTAEIDAVMPKIAAKLGVTIACGEGCPGRCCESLVLVSVPEAWAIAEYLRDTVSAALCAELEARAERWATKAESAVRAAAAWARGAAAEYRAEMLAHGRRHLPCPFQEGQRCAVYPARPLRCRQPWAADTSEHCGASDDADAPPVRLIAFAEMDDLYARADRVLAGLQHAAGRGVERSPLPTAVLAALAAGEPRADRATACSPTG